MNIYESLNHITKLAFPKINYSWNGFSIINKKPIFEISICSNEIEDYFISNYENGLKSIIKLIEKKSLTNEDEYYAKQLMVVLADKAINYHSIKCKNKPEIACRIYKTNKTFRETVIEYCPYLYRLVSNLITSSFFCMDFKTIKNVCENCISKIKANKEMYKRLIDELYDGFTYNHSITNFVKLDNIKKYWKISEYINTIFSELNFYQVNDGQFVYELHQDIEEIKALKPLVKLVENNCYWVDVSSIPKFIEFEYIYPNGANGDIIKYILEEYGETYEIGTNRWHAKISKKHKELFGMFSVVASFITDDERFLSLFQQHYTPSILSIKLWNRKTTESHKFEMFKSIEKILYEHKNEDKMKRREIYSQLVQQGLSSPKWKSEAQLFSLVASLYPDAIYQYHPIWLGMQSLDIYIPSLSVGIEYQGIQHYKPIEHFGGEKHFLHRQANDQKKRELCAKNGVKLIEWMYTDAITEENLKKYLNSVLYSE